MELKDWALAFENLEYKRVAAFKDERLSISTVWLGLNHNFDESGPPHIFETMIFAHGDINERYNELQWRWSTEQEAKEGHEVIVNAYRENRDPDKAVKHWLATKS